MYLLLSGGLCILINSLRLIFVSQIINYFTIAIIIALTIKGCVSDESLSSKPVKVLYLFSPIIAIFFIISRLMATNTETLSFNILVIVVLLCSMLVFFYDTGEVTFKYLLGGLYGILLVPIFLFVLGSIFFLYVPFIGNVEVNRISELSPNGIYLLEAVQYSQGALGGNTTVTVTRQGDSFNLLIGEIQHRPVQIHSGGWSEFFHIEGFRWEGDTRLYMYPSIYRGGGSQVFNFTGWRWVSD